MSNLPALNIFCRFALTSILLLRNEMHEISAFCQGRKTLLDRGQGCVGPETNNIGIIATRTINDHGPRRVEQGGNIIDPGIWGKADKGTDRIWHAYYAAILRAARNLVRVLGAFCNQQALLDHGDQQ